MGSASPPLVPGRVGEARAWVNVAMARSDFLARLHARFGVPQSVVVKLVQRATRGGEIRDVQRVVRGDDNEVYRVELADSSVVYPRIRRPGTGGVRQEAWAMEQARLAGVPVPDVLLVEAIDAGEGDQQAMVVAGAPGRQLSELLPELSPEARRTAMTNVGRVLALVHAVPTPGVWRPDDKDVWPTATEVRRGFIAERTAEREHLVAAGLTTAEIDKTIELVGASPHTPPRANPVLCHGDISPEHVFVDDGLRICGLIDWGLWHGGSAVGELAYAAMRHDFADFAAIVNGHGGGSLDDPRFRAAISLSIVNQAIGHIAWHHSIGDMDGLEPNVAALRQALADVDRG